MRRWAQHLTVAHRNLPPTPQYSGPLMQSLYGNRLLRPREAVLSLNQAYAGGMGSEEKRLVRAMKESQASEGLLVTHQRPLG